MLTSLILLAVQLGGATNSDSVAYSLGESCEMRDPTERELRCRYGIIGPGRFGLLSYADVPVYQPATPMPGTHLVGVPGHSRPMLGESYEAWEWRVLRTTYGPQAHQVNRGLELLDPFVAAKIMRLEARLAEEGVRAYRRETWRSPVRQAYLFQQGRSRPGFIATATLTSWHSEVDANGNPAGRAVDYDVPWSGMLRFHEIAAEVGLSSFGADSYDPGHVFIPVAQELGPEEIALLRILPRVPEVTLSTGLPVDVPLPEGGSRALGQRSRAFAESHFIPFPQASLALPAPRPRSSRRVQDIQAGALAANDVLAILRVIAAVDGDDGGAQSENQ